MGARAAVAGALGLFQRFRNSNRMRRGGTPAFVVQRPVQFQGIAVLVCALAADPAAAGRRVDYPTDYPPGAILISQTAKTLYLILDGESAIAYPVAVAKRG